MAISLMRGCAREMRRGGGGRRPRGPVGRARSGRGADVVVLEARNRPGGRVEQTTLADGRLVQLGGEVVGPFHEAYRGLVEELGLTLVPAFPSLPGEDTSVLSSGRVVGDDFAWMSDADRASYEAAEAAFGEAGRDRRSRRPVVAPRRRPARPHLGRRVAARAGRDAERRARPRPGDALAGGRVGRAHVAAVGPAQGGRRGRARLLRLRGLGVRARRRGLGHGARCGWPTSSGTACATARR